MLLGLHELNRRRKHQSMSENKLVLVIEELIQAVLKNRGAEHGSFSVVEELECRQFQ